jgi:error-prone DNA polymerase
MRRTGLKREPIENLVLAGAFDSLTTDRRSALWEVGLRYYPVANGAVNSRKPKSSRNGNAPITPKLERQQRMELPIEQDMADLAPMTSWERMAGEYQTMSLYPEGHLMNHVRPKLSPSVLPSDEIPHLKDGMEVWTAGLVIRRQRPLGKAVFITLEDEFGHTPLIVWPAVYAQYRLVLREPVLLIRGTVSCREGTMNIMVTHAESLQTLKDTPGSKNWR